MANTQKILDRVLSARNDANLRFDDLRKLVKALGFAERVKGDHFIYTRDDVEEIINVQPRGGGKAKAYQVKQVRGIVAKYRLGLEK